MKTLVLILLLVGCATQTPGVIRVSVPVLVPCVIEKIDRPDFAVDALPLEPPAGMSRSEFLWEQMSALRADRLQRQAYEKILEAAITACQTH